MKHIKAAIAASLIASSAWAGGTSTEPIILKTPGEYYILAVSPSGEWACGDYLDYNSQCYAFRWNLLSDKIEVLGSADASEGYAISNDGTVAGCFTTHELGGKGIGRSVAGYYRDGSWHILELSSDNVIDGRAHAISPDGKHIAGMQYDGKLYSSYIWKDGKIYKNLPYNKTAFAYSISPDGESAGGWVQRGNRAACYWNPDGELTILTDYESPFSYAAQITGDGKNIIFMGGWVENPETGVYDRNTIYNIETGKVTAIPSITLDPALDIFAASNDLTLVGTENDRAYIYVNGKPQYIDEYLTEHGVDITKLGIAKPEGFDHYYIETAPAISADGKTIGIRYLGDDCDRNGQLLGLIRSMVIRLDQDVALAAPIDLNAKQLDGLNATHLSWSPMAGTKNNGYNVFRNGTKLNSEPLTTTSYTDTNLELGEYSYTVTAIYADGESKPSQTADITIAAKKVQAPTALYSRQKGYNSALFTWETPNTNLIGKNYFDINTATIQGFGTNVNKIDFEAAIRFGVEEMAAYQGCQLRSVAFYPMSEQKSWKINVYTYDANEKLQLLYSETVSQPLEYGKRNVVKLAQPVDVPQGELLVAIETSVPTASESILGIDYGQATLRYSDLLRRTDEADFFSMGEVSEISGLLYRMTWLIDAVLAPKDSDLSVDDVAEYIVSADGNEVAHTADQKSLIAALADGTHTLGVSARYTDGRISEANTKSINIAADNEDLAAVEHVYVTVDGASAIHANWNTPKDKDLTPITYATGAITDRGVVAPAQNNYGITTGALYPPKMLKSYEGYNLNSISFVPMADATFTVMIYEENVQVAEIEVDDYTIGKWNEIKLEKPISIKPNTNYLLAIDCYDVTPNAHAIAVDAGPSMEYYSDLYMIDGDEYWNSITNNVSVNGNWMMGLNISDPKADALPVKGYDVYIDGKKRNAELLTANTFDYDFGAEDANAHTISVDAHYATLAQPVKGTANSFYIGKTGIDEINGGNADLQINVTENSVQVAGASHISIVAADGSTVCSVDGTQASTANLVPGIYVVSATVNGKAVERKVSIVR